MAMMTSYSIQNFYRRGGVCQNRGTTVASYGGVHRVDTKKTGRVALKRPMDIFMAVCGLVVLWPLCLLVAVAVKLTSHGPVFFRQDRLGRHGHCFQIIKFRTMRSDPAASGCAVTAVNDERITPLGSFLRRSKLDEIPQLWNVLLGDMSFVGPRPEVPEFTRLFPRAYRRILTVRPGITHPATLSFRREEEILALANDPQAFYLATVMPEKLAAYERSLEQSVWRDLITIVETLFPFLAPKPLAPAFFLAALSQPFDDIATVVDNIPVYGANAAPVAPAVPSLTGAHARAV